MVRQEVEVSVSENCSPRDVIEAELPAIEKVPSRNFSLPELAATAPAGLKQGETVSAEVDGIEFKTEVPPGTRPDRFAQPFAAMPPSDKDDTPLAAEEEEASTPEAKEASVLDAFIQWAMFVAVCIAFTTLCAAGATVGWQLGMVLCFFFLIFAAGLAVNIEHAGIWQEISRPLWVLVCLLVGCFGTWLSICAVGQRGGQEVDLRKQQSKVHGLFAWPDELKGWIADESVEAGSSHAVFQGHPFFGGSTGDRLLMRNNNASTESVQPGVADAHSFIEFKGDLFFFARKSVTDPGEHLWSIRGATPTGAAELVTSFTAQEIPRSLVTWNRQLFFKVYAVCGSFKTWTHYYSDGTAAGTADQNSGKLYLDLLKACSSANTGTEMRPPSSRLFAVLFLAVVPSTCLAAIVLYVLKSPGVVLNILGGIYALAMLIYLLIVDDLANMKSVLEVSALMYSSCGYGLFGILKLQAANLPEWLAELTDWALIGLSVAFFGAINLTLDMPNATEGWKWGVYAAVQLLLLVLGLIVRLALPVVFAGVGLMVLAYKGAFEGVESMGTGLKPEMKLVLQLSGTFVLGLLVLAAGTLYAFYKDHLEARLAAVIFREKEHHPKPKDAGKKEAWPAVKAELRSDPVTKLDAAALGSHSPRDAPDADRPGSSSGWMAARALTSPKLEANVSEAPAPPPLPNAEDVESLKQLQQMNFHDIIKLQSKLLSSSKGFAKPLKKEEGEEDGAIVEEHPFAAVNMSLQTHEDHAGDTSEDEC